MTAKKTYLIMIVPALLTAAGCATRHPGWDRLYSELSESPADEDKTRLEGRRIVIDPGHGGYFRGAVGADSLSEADVNLGVALYLWGMLEETGADVHLTRTTDRDFLPEGEISASADLSNRMKTANSFDPEVFISIHHNSNIELDRERNGIEIYYKGTDPAASLELAEEIRLHLARNLGIGQTTVKPGNYHVLRTSEAGASVLCEASYISNPRVEEKLKLSNKQRLEAESHFLGLISYFSRGVPRIEMVSGTEKGDTIKGAISFRIAEAASVPVDPSSFRVIMGEMELIPSWDPPKGTISCSVPADLPNGEYTVFATARSVAGATARSRKSTILVNRPVAQIMPLPVRRISGGRFSASVKVLDILGEPVADVTRVEARLSGKGMRWSGLCRKGVFSFEVPAELIDLPFNVEAGGKSDTLLFDSSGARSSLDVSVRDRIAGEPVPFPQILLPTGESISGDSGGNIALPMKLYEDRFLVTSRGYRPHAVFPAEGEELSKNPVIELDPYFGGSLRDVRIALDPAGGGADDSGKSFGNIRGAEVNLDLSKRICAILEAAGIDVALTRLGEESLSDQERIYKSNRFSPQIAVSVRFGSDSPDGEESAEIHHYPGSSQGRSASQSLVSILEGLPPFRSATIRESASQFLQQTGCPAVEIHCRMSEAVGTLHSGGRWSMEAADRMSGAIARFFTGIPYDAPPYRIILRRKGAPVHGAAVFVDGAFTSITDAEGVADFFCLDAGKHLASVRVPGEPATGYIPLESPAGDPGPVYLDLE